LSVRRDFCLDQRWRESERRDSSAFTLQDYVAGRHDPVMDTGARRNIDSLGQLIRALQHLCDRSRAVLPHHRVHRRACEI
jgi:hypothetical protein